MEENNWAPHSPAVHVWWRASQTVIQQGVPGVPQLKNSCWTKRKLHSRWNEQHNKQSPWEKRVTDVLERAGTPKPRRRCVQTSQEKHVQMENVHKTQINLQPVSLTCANLFPAGWTSWTKEPIPDHLISITHSGNGKTSTVLWHRNFTGENEVKSKKEPCTQMMG